MKRCGNIRWHDAIAALHHPQRRNQRICGFALRDHRLGIAAERRLQAERAILPHDQDQQRRHVLRLETAQLLHQPAADLVAVKQHEILLAQPRQGGKIITAGSDPVIVALANGQKHVTQQSALADDMNRHVTPHTL